MGGNTFNVAGNIKPLNMETDFLTGRQPIFIGEADPGTVTSAAKWRIQKRTYSGNKLIRIKWADGNGNYDKVWDDRAGFDYTK